MIERKEYQTQTFLEELKQMVTDIVTSVLNDKNPRQISVTVEPPKNKKGNKK
jgi:DNA topoisomerase-3